MGAKALQRDKPDIVSILKLLAVLPSRRSINGDCDLGDSHLDRGIVTIVHVHDEGANIRTIPQVRARV